MAEVERSAAEGALPGPGRPRSEEAHQAILAATLELLAEIGYERLSFAAVAARAGVGKGTVYRRWPSKLPLVVEAFQQFPTLPFPDTGNVVDDLVEVLTGFVQIIARTPLAFVLPILAGERTRDPELAQVMGPLFRARREPLIRVLERAVARRELPPGLDPEEAADVIMGPIVTRLFFTGAELGPRHVRPFVEAALFGLQRPRA